MVLYNIISFPRGDTLSTVICRGEVKTAAAKILLQKGEIMLDENRSENTAAVAGKQKRKLSKLMIAVIVVCAALLLSMVGTALTRTNFLTVKEIRFTGTLKEVADMIKANNEETGRDVDILFDGTNDTAQFCMTTYVPKNATKENPAPVIIGAHGWNNTQEMQMENIVELTRRGFVVVVFDLGGHGRSDAAINDLTKNPSGQNTEGAVVAVEYAMSLPYADVEKVGVTGHSAGDLTFAYTINWLNATKEDGSYYSKHHIAAFFCPTGTISAMFVSSKTDLILGIATGKLDELDTYYFGTADFLGDPSQYNPLFGFVTPAFLVMTKGPYSGIMGQQVEEGVYYNKDGKMTTPETGKALAFSEGSPRTAVAIWNPNQTHVQGTWSVEATALNINFFYAAFGTPTGAKVLASSNQVWWFAPMFQLIGLLAFFASAFVFGALLLKAPFFKSLKREPALQENLPSIKSWKEIVPLIITFIPLFLMLQLYFKCFNAADNVLVSSTFNIPMANGPAWFTFVCGVITFAMLAVNYLVKRLCHIKDKEFVASTLAPAKLDGFGHFVKTVLYVISVVVMMYIPCIIGYYVFNMSFGISVYTVGVPRLIWLPTILARYLPFWLVFMVANAIVNNLARFKEVPEWASTLFCTVANVLPVIIMIIINYVTLSTTGLTKYTFGDPTIMSWNLIAPMVFIGISARYFYKKTGNSWAGALINALIVCLMATSITRHTTDFMFGF